MLTASGKCIDEHEGIVESETLHVVCAVESTTTVAEVLVGQEQAAVSAMQVFDDVLVTTVGEPVNNSVAVSCVESAYPFTLVLGNGTQCIVYSELKQQ